MGGIRSTVVLYNIIRILTEQNGGEFLARYRIVATCTFGLESVLSHEVMALGYETLMVENGRVVFEGNEEAIARSNLWLRTADRVLIRLAEFPARDFEELFQGTLSVPWEDIIPRDGKMPVTGRSVKSRLFSVPDCQAVAKKAVVEAMKRRYRLTQFEETGPLYRIEVSLLKDMASITLDTSGAGLHRRGYRFQKGETPLRETLAAGLVLLSRWTPERPFADPLCGSGTIAIEAALLGRNMAPGLRRSFVSEEWPQFPQELWKSVREEAKEKANNLDFRIHGSDIDGGVLRVARENAGRSGVGENVFFQRLSVKEFRSSKKYGCIVCNPPYGERVGTSTEVEDLYRVMGEVFSRLEGWSCFVLTAHQAFEDLFGRKAAKNRKLFNGDLRCYYYQYLGPLPRRVAPGGVVRAE
jgi:putative N6-adenine-specific DNA methylase